MPALRWARSNVTLTFLFRISGALAQGIWDYSSMPAYIFLLEGSTKAVGLIEGLQGCCTAAFGIPAGYLADAWRRDRVLQITGVVNAAAIAVTLAALAIPKGVLHLGPLGDWDARYAVLGLGLCLWGTAYGAWPITDALFADSVPSGQRERVYTQMYSSCFVASALGPCLAALLFYLSGNEWHQGTLRTCIAVGMGIAVVPCALSFLFNDDAALGAESAALTQPLLGPRASKQGSGLGEAPAAAAGKNSQRRRGPWLAVGAVPYIMAASDALYGLASGCTIKFFPIFFLREVGLKPLAVNAITAAVPVVLAASSFAMHPLSKAIGRVQTIVAVKLLGALLLAWMGLQTSLWRRPALLVGVYLVRTTANNSTYALQKSILADYVSKEARAKWSSLDSLFVFSWSGSAMVGGYLVDLYGFNVAFISTAALQLLAWSLLLLLLPLVPRRRPPAAAAAKDQQEEEAVEEAAAGTAAVADAVGAAAPLGPASEPPLLQHAPEGGEAAAERGEARRSAPERAESVPGGPEEPGGRLGSRGSGRGGDLEEGLVNGRRRSQSGEGHGLLGMRRAQMHPSCPMLLPEAYAPEESGAEAPTAEVDQPEAQ